MTQHFHFKIYTQQKGTPMSNKNASARILIATFIYNIKKWEFPSIIDRINHCILIIHQKEHYISMKNE